MHNGQRGLASAILFCSLVASVGAIPAGSAGAAQDCLATPRGSTPQGKHWYYRIERPSKRQCWYLGDEGKHTSRRATSQASAAAEPPNTSPAEKATPPQKSEPMQPGVANARAELTNDLAVPFTTMAPIGQKQTIASATRDNPAPQTGESAPTTNSRFAERWPDQNSNRVAQANIAAPLAPAPAQPVAVQQANPQPTVAQASPSTSAAVTPDDSPDVLRIVLGIVTAAIALAAIIGRLLLSHVRPRKRPAPRRPIWQTIDNYNAGPAYVPVRIRDPSLRARAELDVEDLLRALRYPEGQRPTAPTVSANRGQKPTGRSGARA